MIRLVVPNGSLEERTLELLNAAGFPIKRNGRKSKLAIKDKLISEVLFTRPQSIPRLIENGIYDIGICGIDCCFEEIDRRLPLDMKNMRSVMRLMYSKCSVAPVKIVVVGATNDPADCIEKVKPGSCIYSEYPNCTNHIFGHNDIRIHVIPSPGSTEAHIPEEFQYGVCAYETGKTAEENGLKIIQTLFYSDTILIVHKRVIEDRKLNKILNMIISRLSEARNSLWT
jgi:ATP phosphoribosyltransferase